MRKLIVLLYVCFLSGILFPKIASAVPPPDFLFTVGSSIAAVFSAITLVLSAFSGVVLEYMKIHYHKLIKKRTLLLTFFLILLVAGGISYGYSLYQQDQEYKEWIGESNLENLRDVGSNSTDWHEKEGDSPKTTEEVSTDSDFWETHQNTSLSISNEDFQSVLNGSGNDYIVLDARENLENEYGHFPGSTHIRYADLFYDEGWEKLPSDKFIYVLCWSGIRGEEVASFLREQNLVAISLVDGASGWVEFGGTWEGEITFTDLYSDSRYSVVFTPDETRAYVADGVIIVDAREPEKIADSSIPSIGISLMYTISSELEAAFSAVPPGSRVITLCDEYTNCFMAKLVGVELERRGHTFLGRFNKPWSY